MRTPKFIWISACDSVGTVLRRLITNPKKCSWFSNGICVMDKKRCKPKKYKLVKESK